MAVTPTGSLYGPSLASSVDGASSFEGILKGLSSVPGVVSSIGQVRSSAQDVYNKRVKGNQEQADYAAKLVKGLTYGGGNALANVISGTPGTPSGSSRGGANLGGKPPVEIHTMQAKARELAGLRAMANDQQSRRNYGVNLLQPDMSQEDVARGLSNPSERIGLPPGMVLRPDSLAQIAQLLESGDPTVRAALNALGLPDDFAAGDLTGMSTRAQEYQSELAARVAEDRDVANEVDLTTRAAIMKSRMQQLGFSPDNIDELSMELARMTDEAASQALKELGRPVQYSQEKDVATIRSESKSFVHNYYHGLKNKRDSSGNLVNIGGSKELSEVLDLLTKTRAQINGINSAHKGSVEPVLDSKSQAVIDPATGQPKVRTVTLAMSPSAAAELANSTKFANELEERARLLLAMVGVPDPPPPGTVEKDGKKGADKWNNYLLHPTVDVDEKINSAKNEAYTVLDNGGSQEEFVAASISALPSNIRTPAAKLFFTRAWLDAESMNVKKDIISGRRLDWIQRVYGGDGSDKKKAAYLGKMFSMFTEIESGGSTAKQRSEVPTTYSTTLPSGGKPNAQSKKIEDVMRAALSDDGRVYGEAEVPGHLLASLLEDAIIDPGSDSRTKMKMQAILKVYRQSEKIKKALGANIPKQ